MNPATDLWTIVTICGMALLSVITRCFFFLSSKQWPMPACLQRGLHYAPIAALGAVIVPEMVTTQGQLITTWQDGRPVPYPHLTLPTQAYVYL